MGFLDIFKKKDLSFDTANNDLKDDPFKSDPFLDTNSGLNLPKEDLFSDTTHNKNNNTNSFNMNNAGNNQFQKNPYAQEQKNPFQRYQETHQQTQPQTQQFQQYPSHQYQPQTNNSGNELQKDIQIIIAKLDALRAEIQSISHRIENLERNQKKMW